ncbi:MAG: hypothetical protein ABIR28_02135 [Vicinamibacteria bacterium]
MRIPTMRFVASTLAMSIMATAAGAAEPKPSLWRAAQAAGANSSVRLQTTAAPATGNPRTDRTFFKTTGGKIALGLMAVGVGATVYSASHDRKPVKSPIR